MKDIFILCDMIHINLGGLARVVLNRSSSFDKKGYNVTILTIDPDKDYKYIADKLREREQLVPSVDIINIYNYYDEKNAKNSFIKKIISRLNYYLKASKINEPGCHVIDEYEMKRCAHYFRGEKYLKFKKWRKGGSLKYIDYFNENGIKIRREHFLHGFLIRKIFYDFNTVRQKKYYTNDGFCYLIELFNKNGKKQSIFLFERDENKIIKFNNDSEFHKHFLTELCGSCKRKPYLICDGSGPTPKISNIDSSIAYKISQLHSNPYIEPHCFGSPIRPIGILDGKMEKVDAFLTLTERQKRDMIKEFGNYDNVYVIPNFVLNNKKLNLDKKPDKISIFTRFSPEKNVEDALKIFKLVVNKRKNAKLEIFGRVGSVPGERREFNKIKKLIKKLELENNVFLKGFTVDTDKEMAESVATLLVSKFEGFPMVVLESMLNSTPVISYDINYGPSDAIDHGINGFLVEPDNIEQMAEYIIELLDNTEKAKKMGSAARKKVLKNYTEDNVIPKWEELFEIISKAKR